MQSSISIHALLAESDEHTNNGRDANLHFYPRSPCGERHDTTALMKCQVKFLSTLSLRRATARPTANTGATKFLSTLSLRRATLISMLNGPNGQISIHALLAESDSRAKTILAEIGNFYPRSPCGERHIIAGARNNAINFYPRSPCGERPPFVMLSSGRVYFYPRSPCGERRFRSWLIPRNRNFYPRSPCGERRLQLFLYYQDNRFLSTLSLRRATSLGLLGWLRVLISIHALLAESDGIHYDNYNLHCVISIHALLAESDMMA